MSAPALLTLDCITAATPEGKALFSDLDLSIGRERIGLVGRNGCGKSTLLAIVAGEASPQSGSVHRAGRIASLRQIQPEEGSVAQALGVADALALLDRMEAGSGTLDDVADADWTLPERLETALADVGLSHVALDRRCETLSGGERTRLGLAAMLLTEPDLLLLDEPTNNLDAQGRGAIVDLLGRWPGGALVASHDRGLLETMDRIVQLSPVGILSVTGGWSDYVAQRDAMRERAQTVLDRSRRDLVAQERAAQRQIERKARRDQAGRALRERGGVPKIVLGAMAQQAQESGGRDRQLADRLIGEARESLDQARQHVEILTPLHIDLPPSQLASGRTLLRFDDVVLALGGRRLFGPLSFEITGPRRVAVSGPNGSGKTSLLALATGAAEPTSGRVFRADGLIAMLDQHVALLDAQLDLVENMRARHPGMSHGEAHAALARAAFRNRDALKPAGVLSGGERLRAGLAIVTTGSTPPQLLILDEPTNHLDLDAIETLEEALRGYDGALLVVSHDETFLEHIGIEQRIALGA
jgi:ATPase subunit of ABC transporter with duplicated ATPase domains